MPIDAQAFPIAEAVPGDGHTLPLRVEQQVADDLACLAAIEEGAQSVAAVCIEEHIQPSRLTVRFAALDLSLSGDVKAALHDITETLAVTDTQVDALFEQIAKLHFRRLLARLRSRKWEKPKHLSRSHKKPLWRDFTNLVHRAQFLYTKREATSRRAVENRLQSLASNYEAFEAAEAGSDDEFDSIKRLVKTSYRFCTDAEIKDYAQRLEDSVNAKPTALVASAIKCLRQIEKIGAYQRIARSLADTARQYPVLFHEKIQLEFLMPYKSVPTTIGYESWAKTCHVHAEIQLAVYYDLLAQSQFQLQGRLASAPSDAQPDHPNFYRPRVIGTSKWLCYLCYLFLRYHGRFVPTNTHGRLYDQWTVPDLAEYDNELFSCYRSILQAMDDEVVGQTASTATSDAVVDLVRWRVEPMTSRQNLLCMDVAFQGT